MGGSPDSVKLALNRLKSQGILASPARGFYVILPPEYRGLGCLPPDQFIPDLMARAAMPYYAGLLSAAQFHGSAHQRPQEFQVVLPRNRRPIECGKVRVAFIARKSISKVPVQLFNTPRGTIRVSTIEATLVDLVGYPNRAGGLEITATIISELSERIDPFRLVEAAQTAPLPWAQRLGHLLEGVSGTETVAPLKQYVRDSSAQWVPLSIGSSTASIKRDKEWKVDVNAAVEVEI